MDIRLTVGRGSPRLPTAGRTAALCLAFILASALECACQSGTTNGRSGLGWTQAFESGHAKFSREYAFTEWKGVDWEALRQKFSSLIASAESRADAGALVEALRAYAFAIPDGHISINGPGLDKAILAHSGGGYGFTVAEVDEGGIMVNYLAPGGPAARAGMRVGAEIIEWNLLPVMEALNRVSILWDIHSSPPATAEHERITRLRLLPRAPAGAQAVVTFRNPGSSGSLRAALMAEIDDYATLKKSDFAAPADISTRVDFRVLPGGLGYVKVTALVGTEQVFTLFQQAMTTFVEKHVPGVIVDLRGNVGGQDKLAARLCGFFHRERSFYETYTWLGAVRGSIFIEPQTPYYDGPVIALVNPATVSSGEGVVMGIQRAPRGLVVGFHGTNGSFGMTFESALFPNGIVIRYPAGQSLDERGIVQLDSRDGRGGVAPDIRVPLTRENAIAFAEGRDVELDFAISYLAVSPPVP